MAIADGPKPPGLENQELIDHPDYYKRPIIVSTDGRRLVVSAEIPQKNPASHIYLALEVDELGLPMPEARVQPIGVMNLEEPPEPSNRKDEKYDGEKESHFRLGGASVSIGVYSPDTGNFGPYDRPTLVSEMTDQHTGKNDGLIAAKPTTEEMPGLDLMAEVALGIARRDWPDINSRHNPDRLADLAADYAARAFYLASLTDFDHHNRPPQETELYKQLASAISNDDIWQRMTSSQRGSQQEFLDAVIEAANHSFEGRQYPSPELRHLLSEVIEAMIKPSVPGILAEHQGDIADIEAAEEAAYQERQRRFDEWKKEAAEARARREDARHASLYPVDEAKPVVIEAKKKRIWDKFKKRPNV